MKKPILYFIAGMFLSISVFAFWAFKSKTDEVGTEKYTVVEIYIHFFLRSKTIYPDGKVIDEKFQDKTISEVYTVKLNEMNEAGYTFVESNLQTNQGGTTCGSYMIFKKR
jgi:hypothetical protein